MAKRGYIVVKKEELHPEVREKVDLLIKARKERSSNILSGGFEEPTSILGLGAISGLAIGGIASIFTSPAIGVTSGALGGIGLGLIGNYKEASPEVRKATDAVYGAIRKNDVVDERGEHKAAKLRTTHVGFVDRKGNVHLLSRTLVQRALLAAHKTLLVHLLPTRKRFGM